MFLRIATEGKVENYRNLIMEGEAPCVGFGSCWPGEVAGCAAAATGQILPERAIER